MFFPLIAHNDPKIRFHKKRTKTAETTAKRQPHKQFFRETFSTATPLEVNINKR